jgi:hypothetical protein
MVNFFVVPPSTVPQVAGASGSTRAPPAGSSRASGAPLEADAIEIDSDEEESGEEVEITDDRVVTPISAPGLTPSISLSSSSKRMTRSQTRRQQPAAVPTTVRPRIRLEGPIDHPEPSTGGKFDSPPPKPRGRSMKEAPSKKGKAKAVTPPSASSSDAESSGEVVVQQIKDLRAQVPKTDLSALAEVRHFAERRDFVSPSLFF